MSMTRVIPLYINLLRIVYNFLLPQLGWWSDTDNKANLSPASLRYDANGAVAELGNIFSHLKRQSSIGNNILGLETPNFLNSMWYSIYIKERKL